MQFNYTARNNQGEVLSGLVEAGSRQAAINALQEKGLIILGIEKEGGEPIFSRKLKFFQRVKSKDMVGFSRQLSILISAQVPLLASLKSLALQTENHLFSEVIYELANDVEGGTAFSKALAKHPKIFSPFFVNMVKSGEVSGSLQDSLLYLADYLEKQYYLMTKIRGAMIYPAFIMGSFILIGVLMMILVVPKLIGFLSEAGQDLPLMTKILIGVSSFLSSWWWLLLLILLGGGGYLYYSFKNSQQLRDRWDQVKLKMPIFGKKVFLKLYVTRLAENLSVLIQGGLSILQALQVTSEVIGNTVFKNIVIEAKENVRVGASLSDSLRKHKEIPPLVVQMIATGEQTGSVDSILKKMSSFYSKEIDATVENLAQLIEPLLILLIGGAVAILVASILMPIYNIANAI